LEVVCWRAREFRAMSTAVKHSHCHLAVKSPAAAGANLCYIACGAGIIVLPNLSGAFNSDVWTLLAFNMIFLGLASFSFHYNGDLLHHWSHRADLTFILILMGALPFLAANGLKQAYNGKPAPPRDKFSLITKTAAIALGGCVHWPVIPPSLPFPSPTFPLPSSSPSPPSRTSSSALDVTTNISCNCLGALRGFGGCVCLDRLLFCQGGGLLPAGSVSSHMFHNHQLRNCNDDE